MAIADGTLEGIRKKKMQAFAPKDASIIELLE